MDQHFAHLATNAEYLQAIAKGTKPEHIVMDIDFSLLTDALASFGIGDLYHLVTKDSIDADQVQIAVTAWAEKLAGNSVSAEQRERLTKLWSYLAEDDAVNLAPADVIFVFGGPETIKARKAVELYKAGKAPRIVFTGDTQRALVDQLHVSESVRDATIAIEAGVPKEAILIDDKSINTPENVQNALKLLSEQETFPTRFILVNLPWYLRRATNTFLTYWRSAPVACTSVQRVNAGSEQYNAENYYQSRRGLEYVVFEYLKIYMARAMGHM